MGAVIVVVEGPSAAGMSTWCATAPANAVVPETAPVASPPSMEAEERARFRGEMNCSRWSRAVDVETAHGVAICDTDPFKLHYDYCRARVGRSSWDQFDHGVTIAVEAVGSGRLGIADLVIVSIPDDATLRRRCEADTSRRRSNFEVNRLLGPALGDWYTALDHVDPGRVRWEYPPAVPRSSRPDRYDVDLLGEWMSSLPR